MKDGVDDNIIINDNCLILSWWQLIMNDDSDMGYNHLMVFMVVKNLIISGIIKEVIYVGKFLSTNPVQLPEQVN